MLVLKSSRSLVTSASELFNTSQLLPQENTSHVSGNLFEVSVDFSSKCLFKFQINFKVGNNL